ncbi:MAG: phosphate signaling complex protein PhoU [Bacillota bacterium]|jgi:phosphate transport system protein
MTTLIETEILEIEKNLKEMIQLVLSMHRDAKKALETNDSKLAIQIIKRDEQVNNLDELINESVLTFLATQAPVAKDLRSAIAMIRVANDVERIGDYAKTISEFIILTKPLYEPFKVYINDMFDDFIKMFQLATSLFFEPVLEDTYTIANQDQFIDAKLKKAFNEIPKVVNTTNVMSLLDTFNIIRTLERAGDHTKNICEAVIFKLKGKKIDLG